MSIFKQAQHTIDLAVPFSESGFWTVWMVLVQHLNKKATGGPLSAGTHTNIKQCEQLIAAVDKTTGTEQANIRLELASLVAFMAKITESGFEVVVTGGTPVAYEVERPSVLIRAN